MNSAKEREHSSSSQHHPQTQHPQASSPSSSQHVQPLQGQQLVEKLQHKLQGHKASISPAAAATAPMDSDTALAASSQPHTDHHSDRRHHKASHAHFADDDSNAVDDTVTGRNESITAVRGAAGGESSSHAEGSFWKGLDAEGSYRGASGGLFLLL